MDVPKPSGGDAANCSEAGNSCPPLLSVDLPSVSEITTRAKEPQLPVEIVLLTVEKYEFLACYRQLKDPYRWWFDGLGYVYFEDVDENQEDRVKVALLQCERGSVGPGSALITAKNAVTVLKPKAIISVGICSGLCSPEKTQLGDVVVSAKVATYAPKVVTNNQEQSTGMRSYVSKHFLSLIKNCADGWQAPLKNSEDHEVKIHCGEFLSGPELVKAEWRRKQLAELHPQAVALEMEAEGIFTVAFDSEIEWLLVKGIADFADGAHMTTESWCSCASVMAASLVKHILGNPAVFRSWPHFDAEASKPFDLKQCQGQLQTFYDSVSKVQITPWNPDDTVHIDDVYTNLSWLRDHKTPRGTSQEKLEDYGEIFQGTDRCPNPKRILIYGRPGIGKTTFSQKIAFDWANGRKEILKKFDVLLMIRLRDVCGLEDFGAVLNASKLLAVHDSITVENLHNYVFENQDKVLLVLDGYDEYHAGASSLIDQIWERNLLRHCYAIMTTRLTEVDKVRKSSDVQLEIIGFDTVEQVIEFASKYLASEEDVKELIQYLCDENVWDVVKIPLLLLMMCLIWRDRHHRELPKSELELYARFVETLLYHMTVKDSDKSLETNVLDIYKEELTKIGKLALDALLRGTLYFPFNQIHTESKTLSKAMIRSGLFQISKLSSASPNEAVFFLHKSIQEFLAAWFIMHESDLKDGKVDCLSSIHSFSQVLEVKKTLQFMVQWSAEGALAVFSLVQFLGEKEGLTEYNFTEVPIITDLSVVQKEFCTTCLDFYKSCKVSYRQAVSPLFLSSVHGVIVVGENQKSYIARDKVLKFSNSIKPDYLLFESTSLRLVDDSVLSIMCDLETVIVTCHGETRSVSNCCTDVIGLKRNESRLFCLKKKGQQMILCLVWIYEITERLDTFLRLLTSPSESPQTSVDDLPSIITNRTSRQVQEHSLSFLRKVTFGCFVGLTDENLSFVIGLLPFLERPQVVSISIKGYTRNDGALSAGCCSQVPFCFTDNLFKLTLRNLILTATCASKIARSLHKAPNLRLLDLSGNNFCRGPRVLVKNLQHVPNEDNGYQLLTTSLKHLANLQVLVLSRNPLGYELIHLANQLHSLSHLIQLDLSKTQMGEEEVSAIARKLQNVSRLKILNLNSNRLGRGVCELCQHLHSLPHLIQLDLSETQMGKEEVTAVARALKDVPELEKLFLSHNPLGHGVTELGRYLSCVSKLTHLFLTGVHMTKEEASDLCTALRGTRIDLRTDYHIDHYDKGGLRVRTEAELEQQSMEIFRKIEFDRD